MLTSSAQISTILVSALKMIINDFTNSESSSEDDRCVRVGDKSSFAQNCVVLFDNK